MVHTLSTKMIAIALVASVSFLVGWQVNGWRKDGQIHEINVAAQESAEQARKQVEAQEVARALQHSITAALDVERQNEAKVVERVVVNEVIKYVQTPGAAQCGVDATGVRLINTARSGRVSKDADSAGPSDAATGRATAAEVVTSVTQNYGICVATQNQLLALQDWVRALNVGSD